MALPTASDNAFPSVLITEGTVPASPAASKQRVYANSTSHRLVRVNSSGVETIIEGINSGTAFPVAPADGDLFYRTDIDLLCRYRSSGTRWVTTDLKLMSVNTFDAVQFASGAFTNNNGNAIRMPLPSGKYLPWIEWYEATPIVLTTNNATNYWTFQLKSDPGATNVGSTFNTSADTVSTWTKHDVTVGAALTSADLGLTIASTKTLSPGAWGMLITVAFRLIVT